MKEKKDIKTILFITLSNLGDIVLTTPVFTRIHESFPDAAIDVITGMPGLELFVRHPASREIFLHKRAKGMRDRLDEILRIRGKKYDLLIDLKNSLVPYVSGSRYHTGAGRSTTGFGARGKRVHKVYQHLSKLEDVDIAIPPPPVFYMPIEKKDTEIADGLVGVERPGSRRIIVVNPGAKSHLKRWPSSKYAELCDRLVNEKKCRVAIIGNDDDKDTVRDLLAAVSSDVIDLTGKTSLGVLAEVIRRAGLLISNDSAPMHIASAVDTKTLAIFGPSDDIQYGPLAKGSRVVRSTVDCRPCGRALCAKGTEKECIPLIKVSEVFQNASEMIDMA